MQIDINALRLVEKEKGINLEVLLRTIEDALLKAYFNQPGAMEKARVEIDEVTGNVTVIACEQDENGEPIGEFDDTPINFSRIGTTIVRSIIKQRIFEVEDNKVIGEYKHTIGTVISGVIQQGGIDNPNVLVDIGGVEAMILPSEQVPNEKYNHGDRIKAYVLDVTKGNKGPRILLSRTHPELVRQLFKLEVPDIQKGLVEIVAVAREAGHRSKIAVRATQPNVNAVGTCIGPMFRRVKNVIDELGGEKIDIIDYSEDPTRFVANALSPARVAAVNVISEEEKKARVIVPDFQLSLAIGKEAQNVRLAARLTGWKIDIQSDIQETGDVQTSLVSQKDKIE
ncbi:transcription termination/antitermination protein NusA [Actinomyces sp. zg-332]|uniref:transcription termination factor NusA n=1 Tax=Actinomyces sp. zg-332 TaxID=2708340 RepID=UPI001421BC72|nr:transcription termination factor NusA [Actinomyces sp. zg-332]QPK93935.1 transcription termination/antitermination protein NusA [Actinomyces sp. zg-332]